MSIYLALVYAIICVAKQASSGTTCRRGAHCDRCDQHGLCETECHAGYYGHQCTLPCSLTCRNRKCKLIKDRGIENCTDGCAPGFEGTSCRVETICEEPDQTCYKCPSECDGQFCKTNHRCVSGCIGSYYGSDCLSCTSNCEVCDRVSGTCLTCKANWGGHDCQNPCTNCLGDCSKMGCTAGCKGGHYGLFCNKMCSNSCKEESDAKTPTILASLSACDSVYGTCLHGCKDGWRGRFCSMKCRDECRNKKCSEDGTCKDGCMSGYHGSHCLPCSEKCHDKRCDFNTGACYNGCRSGFYGKHCNETCEGCTSGRCSQTDGHCLDGCKPSYYGERCEIHCSDADGCLLPSAKEVVHRSESSATNISNFYAVGLGILVLLSIAIGGLSGLVCRQMHRKRNAVEQTGQTNELRKEAKMCSRDQEMSYNWYCEVTESMFGSTDRLEKEKQTPDMKNIPESAKTDQAYYLTLVSE